MSEKFELKPISHGAIAEALGKARHYRNLNEPAQAESICRDILRAEEGNQDALVLLILSMSDQLRREGDTPRFKQVRKYLSQLNDEYSRLYYSGLVAERRARAMLRRGFSSGFAYDQFVEAMELYEKAEKIRPAGNDDAILRWNSCVRTIRHTNIRARPAESEIPLE